MTKSTLILTMALSLLTACGAVIGSTGQDTSFGREGTLNCEGSSDAAQTLVQGTTQNPVRCGPQSQGIPR